MNPKKKDKLQGYIRELEKQVKEIATNNQVNRDVLLPLVKMVKDIDLRFGAVMELLTDKAFTRAELEEKIDGKRGVRLVAADEAIKAGDIVWVDFLAKVTNDKDVSQKDCVVHIGSGQAVFEESLIGKKVGESATHEVKVPPSVEGEIERAVTFDILIHKAKTMIGGANAGTGTDGTPGN